MASLSEIFKTAPEETKGSDKLLDLFRNRAELKKEFAVLREEKYRLQDRVKHHEGATARVQQRIDHLENLLLDREWVHNVVAFYQLRRLAGHCKSKLARFAEQLKQQREKRIHGLAVKAWNEGRDETAAGIEREIGEQRLQVQLMEDRLQSERHRLMTMNGISKIFRGRRLAANIDQIAARIELGQGRETELLQALESNYNLDAPECQGLNLAVKRAINFMILSYAQQLYLHFDEDNLVNLAKEAGEKSVGAVNYGDKSDCDRLIERLERRWDSMEGMTDHADVLQKRAKLITEHALFRRSDDATPIPGSVATVFDINANGVVRQQDVNLLGDNYFGIAKILSR